MLTTLGQWNISVSEQESAKPCILPKQVHGASVVDARGYTNTPADGIYTYDTGCPIGVRTADCLPLVLVTKQGTCAIHVSRKTLVRGILNTISSRFPIDSHTLAYIGPHICKDHFSFSYIGREVKTYMEMFDHAWEKKEGNVHISLQAAVIPYLASFGILDEQIIRADTCTYDMGTSWVRHVRTRSPSLTHLVTRVARKSV